MAEPPPPSSPPPPPPPPGYGPPGIYVEQPPMPPPMPRTRHLHDGFYLRLSVGGGALATETDFSADGGMSVRGGGIALDLTLGGTPTPGLVIGGGFLLQEAFDPRLEFHAGDFQISGRARGRGSSMEFLVLGPMIDAFPNPNGGFHLGALIGPASVGLPDQNDNASAGFGLSAWVGYMWWVSSEWSLGGLLRVTGARTERTVGLVGTDSQGGLALVEEDIVDTTRAYALMFSAAFH
jgi:hypothetical protein